MGLLGFNGLLMSKKILNNICILIWVYFYWVYQYIDDMILIGLSWFSNIFYVLIETMEPEVRLMIFIRICLTI